VSITEIDTDAFHLRPFIREILEHASEADPRSIANIAIEKIADEDLRSALGAALPDYVRLVISTERMRVLRPAPDVHGAAELAGQPRGTGHRSWKVRGLQDYGEALRQRIHIGLKPQDWKPLGDCDAADLRAAADERLVAAARTQATAAYYADLAELLTRHAVAKVRELPANVLAETFGGQA